MPCLGLALRCVQSSGWCLLHVLVQCLSADIITIRGCVAPCRVIRFAADRITRQVCHIIRKLPVHVQYFQGNARFICWCTKALVIYRIRCYHKVHCVLLHYIICWPIDWLSNRFMDIHLAVGDVIRFLEPAEGYSTNDLQDNTHSISTCSAVVDCP